MAFLVLFGWLFVVFGQNVIKPYLGHTNSIMKTHEIRASMIHDEFPEYYDLPEKEPMLPPYGSTFYIQSITHNHTLSAYSPKDEYSSAIITSDINNKHKWMIEPGFDPKSVVLKDTHDRMLGIDTDKNIYIRRSPTISSEYSWKIKKSKHKRGIVLENLEYKYIICVDSDGIFYAIHNELNNKYTDTWELHEIDFSDYDTHSSHIQRSKKWQNINNKSKQDL